MDVLKEAKEVLGVWYMDRFARVSV